MAAVTICSDFGAQKNKVWRCFHCFPIYFPWSDGTGCHDRSFWTLSLKPTFSLSTFTFIKRLFSSSSFSAIRVVSSAYLRLLIFLQAILIPAYVSSSQAILMMYSEYKLNKQGDNIQPWRTLRLSIGLFFFFFYLHIATQLQPSRREWQPTPMFLPGGSHGYRSLAS